MDGVVTQHGAQVRPPGGPTATERMTPPPAPMVAPNTRLPSTAAPVWSTTGPAPVGAAAQLQAPAEPVVDASHGRRWSSVAFTFSLALLGFYLLQAAVSFLSWYDAAIRTPGQQDAMVAWAACAGLLLPALLLRGRWRAIPILVATLAGAAAPILLSKDLVAMLGVPDVWIGQGLTLQVLFPLLLGVPAAVAALLSGRRTG